MTYVSNKGGMILPGGDGTGPAGLGPMTGKVMGYCVKENESGEISYIGDGAAEEIWHRHSRGRGICRFFNPALTGRAMRCKKAFLIHKIESIEKELEEIN